MTTKTLKANQDPVLNVGLKEYLNHENRICTIESTMKNIDKTLTEIKNDVHSLRGEYKSYFWKAFGAMGSALAVLITVIQFAVPYIHTPK